MWYKTTKHSICYKFRSDNCKLICLDFEQAEERPNKERFKMNYTLPDTHIMSQILKHNNLNMWYHKFFLCLPVFDISAKHKRALIYKLQFAY